MTGYLIRRFVQMILVVFLATVAIYVLLNLAPGGPLSGLAGQSANIRTRISEADLQRLTAYLGMDKPLALRYFVWLVGDDWLGADWLSISLGGHRVGLHTYRFWADPGPAQIDPGDTLWVRGEWEGDNTVLAASVQGNPRGTRPDDVAEVRVLRVNGPDLETERISGERVTVHTTPDTEFEIRDVNPRPTSGVWLDVGWLFNPYRGLLKGWAGFHGTQRGVLRLDWGTSWKLAKGQTVESLIMSRLGNTLWLMILSTVLSLVVAVPIGVLSAVKQYSTLDYAVTTFSFFGSAMPVFWFGLMMILLFSYYFKNWGLPSMPSGGVFMPRSAPEGQVLAYLNATPGGLVDRIVHLIMPTIVLSLLYMAGWSRFTRSAMLEVLRQDYVRTARAKGLLERVVLGKHALRNAMIPLITIVVFQLPGFFGGATITETVFSYQGMGLLFYNALFQNDWPVVMVILLITSVLTVAATLLGDILYVLVDPRIRLD